MERFFYFIFKSPLYVNYSTRCMRKCKYCDNEIKYEQEWVDEFGSALHRSCDTESRKRIFEHKCLNCNTDLLKDDYMTCDRCDGKYTGYPGT